VFYTFRQIFLILTIRSKWKSEWYASVILRILLYSRGTDHKENTVLQLRSANHTENTSHVVTTQPGHWRADCCLATSCNICPLRHSFHCCTTQCVYRAVTWQCFDQICYNTFSHSKKELTKVTSRDPKKTKLGLENNWKVNLHAAPWNIWLVQDIALAVDQLQPAMLLSYHHSCPIRTVHLPWSIIWWR
jgi:hypothetical protein